MTGWFYKFGAQVVGPIGIDELKELWAQGVLGPETQVRRNGHWQWVAAHALPELSPSPARPASPPVPRPPVPRASVAAPNPAPVSVSGTNTLRVRRHSPVPWIILASGGVVTVVLLVLIAVLLSDRPGSNFGSVALPTAGAAPASSTYAPMSSDQLFARLSPGVVKIDVFANGNRIGNGSGFFVHQDGIIATNYHVVEHGDDLVVEDHSGRSIPVIKIVDIDPSSDLALVKVNRRPTVVLPLAESRLSAIGSQVYAIGSPIGLKNTISPGLISGHRDGVPGLLPNTPVLQITAPISGGSSGGPVISDRGTVVGIATLGSVKAEAQNLNFAVPVSRLRRLMARCGY